MRAPMRDEVQNLIAENECFKREIERFDALYKFMLSDYMNTIEENKKAVELLKKAGGQNFFNNSTIQIIQDPVTTSRLQQDAMSRETSTENEKGIIRGFKVDQLDQKMKAAKK